GGGGGGSYDGGTDTFATSNLFGDGSVSIDFESAVPEPAEWSLMCAGVGILGGLLRSRRRAVLRMPTAT
ncbi:MAG: PEP-CTERM sorting domain-containing protein, partial [Caulobacterales bacterium]